MSAQDAWKKFQEKKDLTPEKIEQAVRKFVNEIILEVIDIVKKAHTNGYIQGVKARQENK